MRKPLSEETKRKISESNKGKIRTQETIEKIKNGLEEAQQGLRPPPSEAVRHRRSKRDMKANYGLEWDDYLHLVKLQNNLCRICNKPETAISRFGTPKRLTIDHCHTTGRIRGLLCDNCNRGLGHLKDDILILESAIEYLRTSAL